MVRTSLTESMRIKMSDDRRAFLVKAVQDHFASEFDRELSDFQARHLVDSSAM